MQTHRFDDTDAVLHARLARAVHLHAAGGCSDAVRDATAVWREWTARHAPISPASQVLALSLTGMLTACRRVSEADRIIAEAGLALADVDGPFRDAYHRYLTVGAAERVLHRQICAHRVEARATRTRESR
ncbi:hypothetical protein ABT369_26430 [Dactylosporangium sp. NPDC000244]|uniref:hypothetical protein n=1 Tax=Dactylosporangium sp. NPDC000244 TaxID=3154365 RepID=UPI00331721EF